jgi:hypothetical protein
MIQTTVSVAVHPDLRGQYRKIIQPSGWNVELPYALPLKFVTHDQQWSLRRKEKRSKGWKEGGQSLYLWKNLQHRQRKKRNKKWLALLHTGPFDDAESVVQWTLRDVAGGGGGTWPQLYWSTGASALVSVVLLSKRNYRPEHKQEILLCRKVENKI